MWRDYVTQAYREARAHWEQQCEIATLGYATEESEYRLTNPAPTFKSILIHSKGYSS